MCQTFEGERQNCGNALFTYKRLSKPRDLPYNEGRQTGRRPDVAVCRKSMGGGFGTDQSASDGGAPDARGLHNPALRGIPVTLSVVVSWLVMGR